MYTIIISNNKIIVNTWSEVLHIVKDWRIGEVLHITKNNGTICIL